MRNVWMKQCSYSIRVFDFDSIFFGAIIYQLVLEFVVCVALYLD